jgi:TRAP-type C4-dicarboxylate transport system permease small subunit
VINLGNHALILAFLSAMVYFGIKLAYISRVRVFQGIPGFSYTWVTLSVPVGSFLMMITTVLKMRALLVHRKEA